MGAYDARVIADGATNYWRLGESSGLTAVDVIGGKNGTISGGVTLGQAGAVSGNTAMAFNGTTGKIVTAAGVVPTVYSWELWVKTTFSGVQEMLSSYVAPFTGDALLLHQAGPGGVFVDVISAGANVGGTVGTSAVNDGSWHHVVVVVSTTLVSIYVDGVFKVSAAVPALSGTSLLPNLGWRADTNTFYTGSLDEVAIYPLALTPAQIAAHYTIGTTPATLTGDRTTAWAYHLKGLAPPKNESERAYLLGQGFTAGGSDLTTLVSAFLDQG